MLRSSMRATLMCLSSLPLVAAQVAAVTVDVGISNFTFSPATVNIQVGDTVRWTNNGGFHNVNADGGDFRSGNLSSAAFVFSHTFAAVGTFRYHCEAHGGPNGVGMSGMVVVGGGGGEPGTLSLSAMAVSVGEAAGQVTLTLTRMGGDDGAVSVDVDTANGTASALSDYTAVGTTVSWADNDDDPKTVNVAITDDGDDEADETFTVSLSGPGGGAALGAITTTTVTIADDDVPAVPGVLALSAGTASIDEAAGELTLTLTRTGGDDGAVSVEVDTAAGTATPGSDYTTSLVTAHWADNDDAPKHVNVPILEDAEDEADETFTVGLSNPGGGASLGATTQATVTIVDNDEPPSTCVPDATTLCLNGGRFQVRVSWVTTQGAEGVGGAVDIGRDDSGLFSFFNPDNVELLVKVLDACGGFDHYWVFISSATNQEWHLTVVDTQEGVSKTYDNPLRNFPPLIADTTAFATCP